jgi:transposase
MERKDLEELDLDAAAASPSAARALLVVFRSILLDLMTLVAQLRATLDEHNRRHAEQSERLAAKMHELELLRKSLYGPKSERRRPAARPKPELSAEELAAKRAATTKKRGDSRAERRQVETEDVVHAAPDTCPECPDGGRLCALKPEVSRIFEYVPARVVVYQHVIHRAVCDCCGRHVEGTRPMRVGDSSHYGPRLHAAIAVAKCGDAMPIHRLMRAWSRCGFRVSRSTATDAFHRVAALLRPIGDRLVAMVAEAPYVNADETPQPVMDVEKCRRGYVWTFITRDVIAYVFSATRSGMTPSTVLGNSTGSFQADAYSGYNEVCAPARRVRSGCNGHARRYFHDAEKSAPTEAATVLDWFHQLYEVEYDAAAQGILGTERHLAMRQARSKPIFDQWKAWLSNENGKHGPKSPLGKAITYAINQWDYLTRCLDDPNLALDNNISERNLRIVALGRDNFRWVGNDEAGGSLATILTLVATCMQHGKNPEEYIADVLLRVATHPNADLDALLPMNWKPLGTM